MDWKATLKDVAKFWTCNHHVLEEVIMLLTAAAFCSRNLTPWCKRRGKNLDIVMITSIASRYEMIDAASGSFCFAKCLEVD